MHRIFEGPSRAPALALVVIRHTTHPTARLSTAALVAAALAAALIVVCLVWGAARWWAYEPRWTVSLRHSLAEAGWRLSASWEEFSDWVRLGR
ncbi:MAG: hypothetical protein ACRDLF_12755 [Solirubrobacteraceae bacterium]